MKDLIKVIIKFNVEKVLGTFVSYTKDPFEGCKISFTKMILYPNSKKQEIESLYFPEE